MEKDKTVKHHYRFFVDPSEIKGDFFITKDKELINQIKNVFRLRGHDLNGKKEGDHILLLDGSGWEYEFELSEVNSKNIKGGIVEKKFYEEDGKSIALYLPLLKKEKFEMVLQKCTELGVTNFIPVVYQNCIVKDSGKKDRWKKIIKEASEQCGRKRMPNIVEPKSLDSVIGKLNNKDTVIFYEKGKTLKRDLMKNILTSNVINILVGPEGGFSAKELESFEKNNFSLLSINKNILRAETACIVSVGIFTELC